MRAGESFIRDSAWWESRTTRSSWRALAGRARRSSSPTTGIVSPTRRSPGSRVACRRSSKPWPIVPDKHWPSSRSSRRARKNSSSLIGMPPRKPSRATCRSLNCSMRQAAQTPAAVALVCGDRRWTYQELNVQGNRLAHRLRAMAWSMKPRWPSAPSDRRKWSPGCWRFSKRAGT